MGENLLPRRAPEFCWHDETHRGLGLVTRSKSYATKKFQKEKKIGKI